jgi:CRISPR-associated endonuclease/helicase Cas3
MWGCNFILGSGTLPRFWENEEIVKNCNVTVKSLIGNKLSDENVKKEQKRIEFESIKNVFTKESLKDCVVSKEGPRLVIMNTVQSAAVFAEYLRRNGYVPPQSGTGIDYTKATLFHLSTALDPNDRDKIVEGIKNKLKQKDKKDWIVVATSCIEAGMDFSFKVAFRETCSTASMIQTGGRVNRHGENAGIVYDFRAQDELFNENKQFSSSRKVLLDLFDGGYVKTLAPSALVTEAMKWETKNDLKRDELLKMEHDADYPGVADLYKIIDSGTRLVVVEKKLVEKLRNRAKVTPTELVRGSVQIRSYRINDLALDLIRGHEELYEWKYEYDGKFLGYMAGLLPLLKMKADKYAII